MITLFFIKLNAILDAVTCRCDLHNRPSHPRACVTPRFASCFACGGTAGPCPVLSAVDGSVPNVLLRNSQQGRFVAMETQKSSANGNNP
jgi:hypothetical protein